MSVYRSLATLALAAPLAMGAEPQIPEMELPGPPIEVPNEAGIWDSQRAVLEALRTPLGPQIDDADICRGAHYRFQSSETEVSSLWVPDSATVNRLLGLLDDPRSPLCWGRYLSGRALLYSTDQDGHRLITFFAPAEGGYVIDGDEEEITFTQ